MNSAVVTPGGLRTRVAQSGAHGIAWLKRRRRRDLLLAGIVIAAATAGLVAAIFADTLGVYARVISAPAGSVPLSAATRAAARDGAARLAAALDARLDRARNLAGDTWSSAQILVALRDNATAGVHPVAAPVVARYFRSVSGPECACWRRQPNGQFPNHLGLSAWVLWALAAHGIAAQRGEIEFLLSTQDRDGGWPQFADARRSPASSYATAAAILALQSQQPFEKDAAQRARLSAAVQRGSQWLLSRVAPGRARWADYPDGPGPRRELPGISGFVLYVLHRVGAQGLTQLDRDWLRALPLEEPLALGGQLSSRSVPIGAKSYRDDTRFYALPWSVLATAAAYAGAPFADRVRALEWLEINLAPGAPLYALTGKERSAAIGAETLLALRADWEGKR